MAKIPKSEVRGMEKMSGSVGERNTANCTLRAKNKIQVDTCHPLRGD